MVFKKVTKQVKKAATDAVDTVAKTATDAADATAKTATDAADAAADAAEIARKAASDAVDTTISELNNALGSSLDFLEDSIDGFSDAAKKLADDARRELERVGDLAKALLDKVFLAALEALVDQLLGDLKEFIDESIDILEDIGKEANAAADLAQDLGSLVSPSDLTDAFKESFVAYTRLHPNFISHALLSQLASFKSVSYGVFGGVADGKGLAGDGGLAVDSRQITEAHTFNRSASDVDMAVFAGYAFSKGTSAGVSVGVEAASWRDRPSNLAGKFLGVTIGIDVVIGVSVAFFFAHDLSKFLGINIGVTGNAETPGADLDVVHGETITHLF